jgi:hypothetical protein
MGCLTILRQAYPCHDTNGQCFLHGKHPHGMISHRTFPPTSICGGCRHARSPHGLLRQQTRVRGKHLSHVTIVMNVTYLILCILESGALRHTFKGIPCYNATSACLSPRGSGASEHLNSNSNPSARRVHRRKGCNTTWSKP